MAGQAALAQQIKAWDNSGFVTHHMAADLALQILAKRVADVPSDHSIAFEWDASERTARRAKKLLAGEGLIRKDQTGRYYLP